MLVKNQVTQKISCSIMRTFIVESNKLQNIMHNHSIIIKNVFLYPNGMMGGGQKTSLNEENI